MKAFLLRWISACSALFFGYLALLGRLIDRAVVDVFDVPVSLENERFLLVGLGASLLIFFLHFIGPLDTAGKRRWRPWTAWDGFMALMLVKIGVGIGLVEAGYLFLSSDDFCRVEMAIRWSEEHWFAPWDHIWLAGQFYVVGTAIELLKDPLLSARLMSLLFSALGAMVLYRLGDRCFGKTTARFSLILFSFLAYPAWLSVSAHPGPFFAFFVLSGVYFLVCGEGKRLPLTLAAVSFCGATMFRYEGLLPAGLYGVWTVVLVASDRSRWNAKSIVGHLLLCLIPFLYIIAWAIDCYQVPEFRDAFRFFRESSGMTPEWISERSVLGKALWYPEVLWRMSPLVAAFGAFGAGLALWKPKQPRRRAALCLAFWAANFVLLVFSIIQGGGNVMAGRVVALSQIFLVPFAVYPFSIWFEKMGESPGKKVKSKNVERDIEDIPWWEKQDLGLPVEDLGTLTPEIKEKKAPEKVKKPRKPFEATWPLKSLAVVLFLGFAAFEARRTFDFPVPDPEEVSDDRWTQILFPDHVRGVPKHALRIAQSLRRTDGTEGMGALLIDGRAGYEVQWIFSTLAGAPHRTYLLSDREYEDIFAALWEKREHLYLGTGDPEQFPFPYIPVLESGPYYLVRFRTEDPKEFIKRMGDRFIESPDGKGS